MLLEAVDLDRLLSRSNKGKKFLEIIAIVNNGETHFFLGQIIVEKISIKIIMVKVQCIINKAKIYVSFSV